MTDIWTGSGIWQGWQFTTDHAASSYGQLVLVDPDGNAYGPGDIRRRLYQADVAREQGVSPAAIGQRVERGTMPPFDGRDADGRGYWYSSTLEAGGLEDSTYRIECSNGWTSVINAKNDTAAKKAASKLLAFGCGDMRLFSDKGQLVGIRRFYQNGDRFGWRMWETNA